MVCHIFWPKAKRSKATHGKRPQEQEPRKLSGVEDLNRGHRREALGILDHSGDQAPEPGVFFIDQSTDCRHEHLLSQQHHEGFKEQSKSTALTGPGNRYQLNSVLRAVQARHCADKLAAALEKVRASPAFFRRYRKPRKVLCIVDSGTDDRARDRKLTGD